MAGKRKGLGRGLDALLGPSIAEQAERRAGEELRSLPLDLLQRGRFQPRRDMRADSLQGLADSIRAQGVIQPILVRPIGDGRYEIIAGERRWRAAQLAEIGEIPAVVRDVADEAAVALALIENIQREDLNPLEEAQALQRLTSEFDMTHEQVAHAVGRSRAAVSNLLRLLDLAGPVKAQLEARRLEMGHARALLALPLAQQPEAARRVVGAGLSVRATERLVKRMLKRPGRAARPPRDPDLQRLETELGERLGASVSIRHSKAGKGQLIIRYTSLDELDGILAQMR